MAQFGSQLKLLPSREVQESLLNCVEEGTKMVTSLVDGSLSVGQARSVGIGPIGKDRTFSTVTSSRQFARTSSRRKISSGFI
jgi:hypothetical protein